MEAAGLADRGPSAAKRAKYDDPLFLNMEYAVMPVTPLSTPTFTLQQFEPCLAASNKKSNEKAVKLQAMFACHNNHLSPTPQCDNCRPFPEFTSCFIVRTDHIYATFPPPTLCTGRNFNYLLSFVSKAWTRKTNATEDEVTLAEANNYLKSFMAGDLKLGAIDKLHSGKRSFMRSKILGVLYEGFA